MKNQSLAVLILFIISACSTSDSELETNSSLVGTWNHVTQLEAEDVEQDLPEGEYLYINQIEFLSDNTFIELSYLVNDESQEIIGYLAKNEGTYEVTGDRLQKTYDRWFANSEDNIQFVPVEELSLVHENQEEAMDYSILNDNTTLLIDFDPCPENALCVDQLEYQRED